jgi:hypothetical protein
MLLQGLRPHTLERPLPPLALGLPAFPEMRRKEVSGNFTETCASLSTLQKLS